MIKFDDYGEDDSLDNLSNRVTRHISITNEGTIRDDYRAVIEKYLIDSGKSEKVGGKIYLANFYDGTIGYAHIYYDEIEIRGFKKGYIRVYKLVGKDYVKIMLVNSTFSVFKEFLTYNISDMLESIDKGIKILEDQELMKFYEEENVEFVMTLNESYKMHIEIIKDIVSTRGQFDGKRIILMTPGIKYLDNDGFMQVCEFLSLDDSGYLHAHPDKHYAKFKGYTWCREMIERGDDNNDFTEKSIEQIIAYLDEKYREVI